MHQSRSSSSLLWTIALPGNWCPCRLPPPMFFYFTPRLWPFAHPVCCIKYSLYSNAHTCVRAQPPQPCPTLCEPMDCSAGDCPLSMRLSQQEDRSGLLYPPGDRPNPGLNLHLLSLLHCKWILYCWATGEGHSNAFHLLLLIPQLHLPPWSLPCGVSFLSSVLSQHHPVYISMNLLLNFGLLVHSLHSLGTCEKCRISGSSADLLNHNLHFKEICR